MENKKIIFLVVLYRKKCIESDTIMTLLPFLDKHRIIIWDNYPVFGSENKCFLESHMSNYVYIECYDNFSLSRVYSSVIAKVNDDGYKHLVILDDDSKLPDDFINEINNCIIHNPESIIMPNVYVKEKKVSPACNWKWFGWETNNERPDHRFLTGINSGITIPVKIFLQNKFNYPKGIKNYGTDTFLFEFIKQNKLSVIISKNKMNHELTYHKTNKNHNSYYRAYKENMKANYYVFCEGKPLLSMLYFIYCFLRSIKVSWVRKNCAYMIWWL